MAGCAWWRLLAGAVFLPLTAAAQSDQKPMTRACLAAAYGQRAAEMARLDSGPMDMLSIDQLLQRRREQERHCLQVADCVATGATRNPTLIRSTTFYTCVRDEMIDQYKADLQRR